MENIENVEKGDIIKLKNEGNKIIEFALVETIELYDKKYYLLTPEDENDDELDYYGIYIFQLKSIKGKDVLQPVEDEELINEIYDEYEKVAGVELGVYDDEYEDEDETEE